MFLFFIWILFSLEIRDQLNEIIKINYDISEKMKDRIEKMVESVKNTSNHIENKK